MPELNDKEAIGVVREYFRKPGVAAVEILRGRVKIGDTVRFRGFTTDFDQKVESMQENHQEITEAGEGYLVGILVIDRVRDNDLMFLDEGTVETVP
jgi:putative protease